MAVTYVFDVVEVRFARADRMKKVEVDWCACPFSSGRVRRLDGRYCKLLVQRYMFLKTAGSMEMARLQPCMQMLRRRKVRRRKVRRRKVQ